MRYLPYSYAFASASRAAGNLKPSLFFFVDTVVGG